METEEAAMKAFELGKGSKIKISFYQAQNNLIPRAEKVQDHGVVGNTHYRVLFVTKINKRVSDRRICQFGRLKLKISLWTAFIERIRCNLACQNIFKS